jgi:hypothetical protein
MILYNALLLLLGKEKNVSRSNNNYSNSSSPRNNKNDHAGASDMSRNGLGGIFAGGMPKLKPAGRGYSKYLNMCMMTRYKKFVRINFSVT